MYAPDSKSYLMSGQTITSCKPVTESLILVDSNALEPAYFELSQPGTIFTNPGVFGNVGSYWFAIRSCVDVDNGLSPPICRDSVQFKV